MSTDEGVIDRRRTVRGPGAAYFLYQGREALCEGPTRTGKSWALLLKADECARNFPSSRQLIVRQTRKSLNESILRDWREEILWLRHPAVSKTASREHQDLYVYPNRSEIYFAGLESMMDTSSPILSTKWDRIFVVQAEETKESAWETLITRLSSFKTPYHQITADCNPSAPSHWLNKRFGVTNTEHRERFRFRHWDNPFFYTGLYPGGEWTREGAEYVEILKTTLTGVRFKRFYMGQWAAADGLILENWDPERHRVHGELENDEMRGYLLHLKGVEQPIRMAYFTAGVDWGWHPDPGCMSVWGYDSPRWHPKIRRFRIAEVMKLKWQREEWADLAEHWHKEYGVRHFSCDRSNPEAISYFNLRLGKRIGRGVPAAAIKCPPIGGGHRTDRDKGSQIDLVREGLGVPGGHQRTYFLDNFPEGLDEELRRTGRPTCFEEEAESWTYLRPKGSDRESGIPDDKCDEHAIDAARMDETFNFARGFGKDLAEPQQFAPESYGAEMMDMKKKRAMERRGRYRWQ